MGFCSRAHAAGESHTSILPSAIRTVPDDVASSIRSSIQFFHTFFGAPATLPLVIASTLLALGLASTVGIIPGVVSDRYARLRHGYSGADCSHFDRSDKPDACQQGADDAQAAAAAATLALNLFTLISSPVVGSISDVRGRRPVLCIGLLLYSLGSAALIGLLSLPWLSPDLFYAAVSLAGAVDFFSLAFAAMSDVLPEEVRAAGFGILLAGFYAGYSVAPSLALVLNHNQLAIFSFASVLSAFLLALISLPETLPERFANDTFAALQQSQWSSNGGSTSEEDDHLIVLHQAGRIPKTHWFVKLIHTVSRPIRDMGILTTGSMPILAAASFFAAMVFSSDKTFVIYYIEDQLNLRDDDIARMFMVFGPVGVIIQAFLIQPLLRIVGEKQLLIICFISGTCHNALYGLARSKSTIMVALCLSQLTKVNFPILSSYASRSASASEQGRAQGALFALNALANAVGPILLEIVYDRTKNGHGLLGPGSMFLCASLLYGVGTVLVSFLPPAVSPSTTNYEPETPGESCATLQEINNALEEPLLNTIDERQ